MECQRLLADFISVITTESGLLVRIAWSGLILKSQQIFLDSFWFVHILYVQILVTCTVLCESPSTLAQLIDAVEYINCIIAEGLDPHHHNKCLEYDTKPSDGEVPVVLEL